MFNNFQLDYFFVGLLSPLTILQAKVSDPLPLVYPAEMNVSNLLFLYKFYNGI